MAWKYNPKDAQECLPAGEYDAVVAACEEKESKAGNPMLKVTWTVYGPHKESTLHDYITNPATLFRLKQIARAMGAMREFEQGTFQLEDYIGKRIRLKMKVESQNDFPDQNKIHAYIGMNEVRKPGGGQPVKQADEPGEQEIPF